MEIDDWTSGTGRGSKQREHQEARNERTELEHDRSGLRGRAGAVPAKGEPGAAGKAFSMDPQDPGSGNTSTRCTFCGNDDGAAEIEDSIGRDHVQVIVACASCGRQFAVLSAN
jgi:hypothetical protein